MESAIICHPFPYVSKGFQSARPSLRFNHATALCLPHFSTSRSPVTRSLSHATCMVERFSESSHNKGSGGNKILRGMTGASLVLACVLGLLNLSGKMNPKLTIAYAFESGTYKTSMLEDKRTGRSVLESLLETMREAGASSKDFGPSTDEVNTLKMLALRHCKSEIGPKALELMKEQYEYCKEINSTESLDSLGMALVELLMFQENYKEARKFLDKQIDQLFAEKRDHNTSNTNQSDILFNLYKEAEPFGYDKVRIAKLILYKAIVHTALENKKGWRKGEIGVQAIAQSMLDNKAWPKEKEAVEWRTTFNKIDNIRV